MFEKDLKKAYLLDFYGDVLTERKKEVLDMYYNEDLSQLRNIATVSHKVFFRTNQR